MPDDVKEVPLDQYERLANSQRIDHLVRRLWAERPPSIGDADDVEAAEAFTSWMRQPAEHGGATGVSRYLHAAYLTRPDLQNAFPDLDGAGGAGLTRWAHGPGRREIFAELLGDGAPLGVNVIGFLGEALGIGEAGRLYVAALEAARLPVSTTALTPGSLEADSRAAVSRDGSRETTDAAASTPPAFNLACFNADFLAGLVHQRGRGFLGGRPTIGQWAWETDVLPSSWQPGIDAVSEVWVTSRYVAENLGRLLPVPVVVVPPPVTPPQPTESVGLSQDERFTFLCMFDLLSTPARKNPAGAIEAYARAFPSGDRTRLVVKTLNGAHRPAALAELRRRAEHREDIVFLDGYLSPGQKGTLLARCDCLVSLHRSEGFGLAIAESMSLGTPVLVTGYSGNMDFTTSENSWLVDWRPTRVGAGVEVYPPDGRWAEPDLDDAVRQLRRIVSEPERRRARADRGREEILGWYSPRRCGEIARARLELLADRAPLDDPALPRRTSPVRRVALGRRRGRRI